MEIGMGKEMGTEMVRHSCWDYIFKINRVVEERREEKGKEKEGERKREAGKEREGKYLCKCFLSRRRFSQTPFGDSLSSRFLSIDSRCLWAGFLIAATMTRATPAMIAK